MSLRDESFLVFFDENVMGQIGLIEKHVNSTPLKNFLLGLLDAGSAKGLKHEEFADHEELQGYVATRDTTASAIKTLDPAQGVSKPTFTRYLNMLRDLGCLKDILSSNRKKWFKITSLVGLAKIEPKEQKEVKAAGGKRMTKAKMRTMMSILKKADTNILEYSRQELVHWNQQLFNGILDIAMRTSPGDKRSSISVEIEIADGLLKITSSAQTSEGSEISMLSDQRLMRQIIAMAKREIETRRATLKKTHGDSVDLISKIPNRFTVVMDRICSAMDMQLRSENYHSIHAMITRLAETTFDVDATESEWFRQVFSGMMGYTESGDKLESDKFKIRFLNELESSQQDSRTADLFAGIDSPTPQYYSFKLDDRLFYSLLLNENENLFLSHEALVIERSGLIQRFYNWARGYYGGTAKPNLEKVWYDHHDMAERLTPGNREDNFKTNFIQALKRHAVEEWTDTHGLALVYGYYVEWKKEDDRDLFRIFRDKNDPLVGDNSRHNQHIRESQLVLESYNSDFEEG
jgi:hypothetical protein